MTARRKSRKTRGSGRRKNRSKARRRSGSSSVSAEALLRGLGVAVLGLGLGYALAIFVLFPAPGPPRNVRATPDLRDRTLASATELLTEQGLVLGSLRSLRHPTVDSGRVLGQSPLPTQLALPSDTVDLVVSLGPERRKVPEVSRLRGDRAADLLVATGFDVVVDSVDSSIARGRVIDIQPSEGTSVLLPGEVRLSVSLGPPTVRMPFILGLTEGEALDTLEVLGLDVVEVEEVFRFGRDQGRVVTQDPAEDTELERGSEVRLQIGRRGGNRQEH